MRLFTTVWPWIFVVAILFHFTVAQERIQQEPPQVQLSLDEFTELYSSAKLKEVERRLLDEQTIWKQAQKQERDRFEREAHERVQQQERLVVQVQQELFPQNFQVLHHTVSGVYNSSSSLDSGVEGDLARFDIELMVRVMDYSAFSPNHALPRPWTVVPLVNTTSTVATDWRVFHHQQENLNNDGEFEEKDPVSDPGVLVMIQNEQQALVTNQTGLFKIQFTAYTRVSQTRNMHSVSLSSLLYPLSSLSFRIAQTSPSMSAQDLSIQPSSAVLLVKAQEFFTDIQATLPLDADHFKLRWVNVDQEQGQDKETPFEASASSKQPTRHKQQTENPPQVSVIHHVLHTIGEGTVQSQHTLDYTTTSSDGSPLNSVEFLVHGGDGVHITSVEGFALQSWSVIAAPKNNNPNTTTTPTIPSVTSAAKVVKAIFKTSQVASRQVTLHVHTEMNRADATSYNNKDEDDDEEFTMVELPRLECLHVVRQTGHVGVIKTAKVEVHEHELGSSLLRVEASELSSQLRLNVDRPIVLSYKYRNPQHNQLLLSVQEHEALETLEATIDRVHYKVVVTETHAVHSLLVMVQSTQLQYLNVFGLPASSSKFTVLVNSAPTKPVRGRKKQSTVTNNTNNTTNILIPLHVGLDPESAHRSSLLTSVELTFVSTLEQALTTKPEVTTTTNKNETLLILDPPRFDMPVSVLTTHLNLPQEYTYNFSGTLGSHRLSNRSAMLPIPQALHHVQGKRVVHHDYEFTILDDMMYDDDEDDQAATGGAAVRILTPESGTNAYFKKLLVFLEDQADDETNDSPAVLHVRATTRKRPSNRSWLESLQRRLRF